MKSLKIESTNMLSRDFRSIGENSKKFKMETEGIEMKVGIGVSYFWEHENDWYMNVRKKEKEEVNEASIGIFFKRISIGFNILKNLKNG